MSGAWDSKGAGAITLDDLAREMADAVQKDLERRIALGMTREAASEQIAAEINGFAGAMQDAPTLGM